MDESDLATLKGFDALPDCATVRAPVVGALYGISLATVWRWRRQGLLPAPTRLGGLTLWRVGDLRAHLHRPAREPGKASSDAGAQEPAPWQRGEDGT